MNTPIAVVSTTNRQGSLSSQVAHHYTTLLEQHGCASQLLSLTDLPADFTASALYEHMGQNADFNKLKEVMEAAQKYVFVVPEYNGSFPGVFKAFIDGLPYPHTFQQKQCALVGVSKGPQGGTLAMSHLTDIFNYLGMHVLPRKLRLSGIQDSQLSTILANEHYAKQLHAQAAEISSS